MTYDFCPDGLHIVTSWHVLARIATHHTDKQVLADREVISLYLHSEASDWRAMSEGEQAFADAALEAQIAIAKALPPSRHPLPKALETHNLPTPKHPLSLFDPEDGGWCPLDNDNGFATLIRPPHKAGANRGCTA